MAVQRRSGDEGAFRTLDQKRALAHAQHAFHHRLDLARRAVQRLTVHLLIGGGVREQ
jgi:hypothetical protein